MVGGNVSERRMQPPAVGVSVVILALGPEETASDCRDAMPSRLWLPLVRRVRQPFLGRWALPGGDLRADRSLEQSAYHALETTTDLHPRYLEQLYTFGDPARSHGGLPMSPSSTGRWSARPKPMISPRRTTSGGSPRTSFPNWPSTIGRSSTLRYGACATRSNTRISPPSWSVTRSRCASCITCMRP